MTYSIGTTAMIADSRFTNEPLTLPDTAALPGSMATAMQLGQQVLCKGLDGSLAWYTFDAERSTPTVPVMVKV